MNKLVYKVLVAIITVSAFSNSKLVISMDNLGNNSEKNIIIPCMNELVSELNSFSDNIKKHADKYIKELSVKKNTTNEDWAIEWRMNSNAVKKENELKYGLNNKIDLANEWGTCPDYMQTLDGISLKDYIEEMSKVYDNGEEGVCRHLSSSLFKRLRSKGFFCAIAFCCIGDIKHDYFVDPQPNHVVVLIAAKDGNETKIFVSDPRKLQSKFCINYRYNEGVDFDYGTRSAKQIQKLTEISNSQKSRLDPMEALLIPLDNYFGKGDILNQSISFEFDLNSQLNFKKQQYGFRQMYPTKIGKKTIDDFKEEAEKISAKTIDITQIS